MGVGVASAPTSPPGLPAVAPQRPSAPGFIAATGWAPALHEAPGVVLVVQGDGGGGGGGGGPSWGGRGSGGGGGVELGELRRGIGGSASAGCLAISVDMVEGAWSRVAGSTPQGRRSQITGADPKLD